MGIWVENNLNEIEHLGHELSLEDIHQYELGILEYINQICKENGIRYFLYFGTALGAVRHHGFIPWDDDLDIAMLRSDYERFLEVFPDNHRFKLIVPEITPGYPGNLATKVIDRTTYFQERLSRYPSLGIWVDIFCLDFVKPQKNIYGIFALRSMLYISGLCVDPSLNEFKDLSLSKRIATKIGHLFFKFVSPDKFLKRTKQLYFNTHESDYVGTASFYKLKPHPYEWYQDGYSVLFEGNYYLVPKEYDKYLTHHYGDWQIIPDKKDINLQGNAYKRLTDIDM